MQYKAFISYSHAADNKLAPILQSSLQQFSKPFFKIRAIRLFRDKTTLSLTPQLWPFIQKALAESEYFILMASLESAKSPWVIQEVNEWLQNNKNSLDNFLIVLTDGNLQWSKDENDFIWNTELPLPSILKGKFAKEPLYSDLRWAKTSEDLSMRNPQFLDEIASIASALHKKPKDQMLGQDIRQHRIFKTVATAVFLLVLSLLTVSVVFAIKFKQQEAEAINQRNEAESQKRNAMAAELKERTARQSEQQQRHQAEEARENEVKARKYAEEKTKLAIQKQSEAEYLLGENMISVGNLAGGLAILYKTKTTKNQLTPEIRSIVKYILPRLTNINEHVRTLTPPTVFNWRGSIYYLDSSYDFTFLSESSEATWGINKQHNLLYILEGESKLIIRSLPNLEIIFSEIIGGNVEHSIYEDCKNAKATVFGTVVSGSVGSVGVSQTIIDLKKSTSQYSEQYEPDEVDYPETSLEYGDEIIMKDCSILSFPVVTQESEMWQKLNNPLPEKNNRTEGLSLIDENEVNSITTSLELNLIKNEFKKAELEFILTDIIKDEVYIYKYKGYSYLIVHYSSGAYYHRRAILKTRNNQVLDYFEREFAGEGNGEFTVDRNFVYMRDYGGGELSSLLIYDLSKMKNLSFSHYPVGDGPYENGISFNQSQSLFAATTNMMENFTVEATGNDPIGAHSFTFTDDNASVQYNNTMYADSSEESSFKTDSSINENLVNLKRNGIWLYKIDSKLDRIWNIPVITEGNIVRIKFIDENILIVLTTKNEIIAYDCGAFRTLWTKQSPLGDESKVGFEVNHSDQTIAVYNDSKIVVISAKSGLLLTDIYSPPNTIDENKIDNVDFDANGNLQIAVGSKLYKRKFTSPGEIENLSPKVLSEYTGISHVDGLTYLKRLGTQH